MELKDQVAIVTGAGRGIGAGIASALAREGARVIVNDTSMDAAASTADQIVAQGGQAVGFKADVSDTAEVDAMISEAVSRFGAVDILVNNAGIEAPPTLLKDLPEQQWERVLRINLEGTFICCKAVIPAMIEQKKGKIVNIASLAGMRMSFFGSADYTASKHGMVGLSYHLAWELAEHRINVNVVCPGATLTPLAEQTTTPELRDMLTRRLIPLGRWCTPDDIGNAAVFLASPRSDMITGQVLNVDGGVMTGYGEDLRAVLKQRMQDIKGAE